MQRYILGRFAQGVVTLVVLSLVVFLAVRLSGDPALFLLPVEATTQEDYEQMKKNLGLDKPLYVQYGIFMGNLVRGRFGDSIIDRRPAREALFERLPATIQLAAAGMLLATVLGIPLGVLSAIKRDSIFDNLAKFFAIIGMATPAFWIAIMGILVFGALLKWLPTYGRGGPEHFILPSVVLSWSIMAGMVRLGRSSMLEILDSEYVRFARVKGLTERLVLWKHALRNAMIPLLTFGGLSLAGLLNGTIVVEVVFAWPGIGRLLLEGVVRRDIPVVQATILASAFFYIVLSLVVDIMYAYVDPRIRIN
jgi:peptide/nickel transport system permease protein